MCVYEWERERERERKCVCVCVRERERESVCVCVWERERESVCVCVRERESVCVCVCVRERERESVCVRERERERESVSARVCVCVCVWERERECVWPFNELSVLSVSHSFITVWTIQTNIYQERIIIICKISRGLWLYSLDLFTHYMYNEDFDSCFLLIYWINTHTHTHIDMYECVSVCEWLLVDGQVGFTANLHLLSHSMFNLAFCSLFCFKQQIIIPWGKERMPQEYQKHGGTTINRSKYPQLK